MSCILMEWQLSNRFVGGSSQLLPEQMEGVVSIYIPNNGNDSTIKALAIIDK